MFFSRPATLRIRSPSPTTIEFTVSNRPPPTIPHLLLSRISLLLRILLFGLTLLTLSLKYPLLPPLPLPAQLQQIVIALQSQSPPISRLLPHLQILASATPDKFLLPVALLVLYIVTRRAYTEESLLVIRSVGVQISTTTGVWWGRKTRFIPTVAVGDVVINEGFKGFEVRFYLAVVVDGEGEVVVVFPGLLPGRRVLERVWRGARGCLFEKV
ncbi:hypothetical protein RUND412_007275 [Rhizina undulata]